MTLSASLLGTQQSLWGMSCAQVCQQDVLPRAICVPALPFDCAELGYSTGLRLQTPRMKGHSKKKTKKKTTASCWKWGNVWKSNSTKGQADTKPVPRYMQVTKTSRITCSGWALKGQRSFADYFRGKYLARSYNNHFYIKQRWSSRDMWTVKCFWVAWDFPHFHIWAITWHMELNHVEI